MQTFFFKMASVTNTSNLKSLTVEEVIEGVFADADSADEAITSESETETSTSEEDDESGIHLRKLTKTTLVKEVHQQGVVFPELLWLRKKQHLRKLKE